MSTSRIDFIDRELERELLRQKVLASGTRQVVYLSGPGGIGKTRLLQELARFAAVPGVLVGDIVDFDDPRFHLASNVAHEIARQLGYRGFSSYLAVLEELQVGDRPSSARRTQRLQVEDLRRYFQAGFNQVARSQRVVIRMDTAEIVQNDDQFEELLELLAPLENLLLVMAGRQGIQLAPTLERIFGPDAAVLSLEPFDQTGMKDYLLKKQEQLYVVLEEDLTRKLCLMSSGRPILIDLAIEWAVRNRPLPTIQNISVQDLEHLVSSTEEQDKQQLRELIDLFEWELVADLCDVRSRADQLILVLSKVFPLDVDGIAIMLEIERDDAQELFQEVRTWSVVKSLPYDQIKLHDVFADMLNDRVWPIIDRDGSRERRDNERAITYLGQRTEKLHQDILALRAQARDRSGGVAPEKALQVFAQLMTVEDMFWFLRTVRLERVLKTGLEAGLRLLDQEYSLCQDQFSISKYGLALLDPVLPYHDQLSPADCRTFQERRAYLLTDQGRYGEAEPIYRELLATTPERTEARINALIGYGNLVIRTGDTRTAIEHFESAVQLAQDLGSEAWLARANLALGWAYRSVGDYEAAIRYYRKTFEQATNRLDDALKARTLNNLAYVYCLQWDHDKALRNIKESIEHWELLVDKHERYRPYLGQAYNTAGEILLEFMQPEPALPYFERAWNLFLRVETVQEQAEEQVPEEWKSRVRSGRGKAYWLRGDLAIARQELEWAAQRATALDLPSVKLRLGHVYWDLALQPQAVECWREGQKQARLLGDRQSEYACVVNLVRATVFTRATGYSRPSDFEKWRQEDYLNRYGSVNFPLLDGLFYTYLGCLSFRSTDYRATAGYLFQGLSLIVGQDHTGRYLKDCIHFIEERVFPEVSDRNIRRVGSELLRLWPAESTEVELVDHFRRWSVEASW